VRAQISPNGNPNAFYTELVTAPYAGSAIISTHVYGPSVTHAATNYSGAGLDWRLSVSFGEKTLTVRFYLVGMLGYGLQAPKLRHGHQMLDQGHVPARGMY